MTKEIENLQQIQGQRDTAMSLSAKRQALRTRLSDQLGSGIDRDLRIGQILVRARESQERLLGRAERLDETLQTEIDRVRLSISRLGQLATSEPSLQPSFATYQEELAAYLGSSVQSQTEEIASPDAGEDERPTDTSPQIKTPNEARTVWLDEETSFSLTKGDVWLSVVKLLQAGDKTTEELSTQLYGNANQGSKNKTTAHIANLKKGLSKVGWTVLTVRNDETKRSLYRLERTENPEGEETKPTEAQNILEQSQETEGLTGYEAAVVASILTQKSISTRFLSRGIALIDLETAIEIQEPVINSGLDLRSSDQDLRKLRENIISKVKKICDNNLEDKVFDESDDSVRLLMTYFSSLDDKKTEALAILLDVLDKKTEIMAIFDRHFRIVDVAYVETSRETSGQNVSPKKIKREISQEERDRRSAAAIAREQNKRAKLAKALNDALHEEPVTVTTAEDQTQAVGTELKDDKKPERTEQADVTTPHTLTRTEAFLKRYPSLARRDEAFLKHLEEIIHETIDQMPEFSSDPYISISPARLTQIYNNISESFMTKAEDAYGIRPPVEKGRRVYTLIETVTLRYIRTQDSRLNLDSRSRKQLMEAVRETVGKVQKSLERRHQSKS